MSRIFFLRVRDWDSPPPAKQSIDFDFDFKRNERRVFVGQISSIGTEENKRDVLFRKGDGGEREPKGMKRYT